MLIDAENWRREFGVDELVKCATNNIIYTPTELTPLNTIRNFKFVEKPQVDKYYPQCYHKTDKVFNAHSSTKNNI